MNTAVFAFLYALGLFFGGLQLLNVSLTDNEIIPRFSKNPITYFFMGLAGSALTQSSSAVTSITVQAADKMLIDKNMSYFVVMGTNIGTTIVCYLIMIDSGIYSLIVAISFLFSTIVITFVKDNRYKKIFAPISAILLIVISLQIISDAFAPMINEIDTNFFVNINPLLMFALTTLATAIYQSSALTATFIIALAKCGILSFDHSLIMIVAANVGTCSTALLSSLGKNGAAKNVALFNIIFNLSGAILHINLLTSGAYEPLRKISVSLETKIAMFHTFFNTTTALIYIIYFVIIRSKERMNKKRKAILR